jgi:hypothetical protein
LQQADEERKALADASITCGHLLLGVLTEADSPSGKLLAKFGITRNHVIEKMRQDPEPKHGSPADSPHQSAHSSVSKDDDATRVESATTHDGHTFTTVTRFRTSADGKKVKVSLQIRGSSGAHEFETEFDVQPGTTGTGA